MPASIWTRAGIAFAGFSALLAVILMAAAGFAGWTWLLVLVLAPAASALLARLLFHRATRAIDLTTNALSGIAEQPRLSPVISNAGGQAGRLVYTYNRAAKDLNQRIEGLETETARLQEVFDSVAEPIVAVSATEDVAFMNAAAGQLFRVTPHGPRRSFLSVVGDHELLKLLRHCLREGVRQTQFITYGTRRVPLQATAMPAQGEGTDWAVVLLLTDLTEIRRLEQVRRDFISNLSHELRTPLAAIKAVVDTLADGAIDDREAAQEFLQAVNGEIVRLTVMVDDLLQLSRIESGAMQLRRREVSVRDMLLECVARVLPLAERKQLRIEYSGGDLTADVDPAELSRAVTNLLSNAVKFLEPGDNIWLSSWATDGDLIIEVRDDGPGVERADLPRLFERFYKGDKARTTEGAGLGLAIVKHIVQAHGGTVAAASVAGRGACFRLRLPARAARSTAGVAATP